MVKKMDLIFCRMSYVVRLNALALASLTIKYKIHLTTFLLLFQTTFLFSQDIHFSQIQETPLWLNPANAGFFTGKFRATANYRSQWQSMGNPYQTISVSVDVLATKSKKSNIGIGLFVFNDKAGVAKLGSTQAQLHVNAIIKSGRKSKLAGGIYAGYSQFSANYAALTFANQYNGTGIEQSIASGENISNNSMSNFDVGAGVNYELALSKQTIARNESSSFKIGFAVHHINRPTQRYNPFTDDRMRMRFTGNIQARIDFEGSKFSVLPSIVYLRQAKAQEIILGTHIRYRLKNGTKITGNITETAFQVGLYYRINDAIVPQISLDLGKYAVGVCYDLNLSKYTAVSKAQGAMEFYLKFILAEQALFKRK